MSVLVRVAISPGDFKLERVLRARSDVQVEIERLVPLGREVVPYLWIRGAGTAERARSAVAGDDDVAEVDVVGRSSDATLVRVTWSAADHPFLDALTTAEATCLQGVGKHETWQFKLRFDTHERLAAFYRECSDRDIHLTVRSIHHQATPEEGHVSDVLTDAQYETLRTALEIGYFSIPRESTLEELADELGISDTAASQRVRRGLRNVLTRDITLTA